MSELGMVKTVLTTGLMKALAQDGLTKNAALEAWLCGVADALVVKKPIDMILRCPYCGLQHIDGPEQKVVATCEEPCTVTWTNPPHRSHLCARCRCVWRPADVPTNGVARIATRGKDDTWPRA